MPQLDTTTYLSQIFWLLASFLLLYYFVYFYFFPKISETVEGRRRKILVDLAESEQFVNDHHELKKKMDKNLNEAREFAIGMRNEAAIEAKRNLDASLVKFEEELNVKTKIEEERLEQVRLKYKAEIPEIMRHLSGEILRIVFNAFNAQPPKVN